MEGKWNLLLIVTSLLAVGLLSSRSSCSWWRVPGSTTPTEGFEELEIIGDSLFSDTFDVQFSNVFSNDMVLQRGPQAAQVYGIITGDPANLSSLQVKVTRTDSPSSYIVPAKRVGESAWSATLQPSAAGGSFEIGLVVNDKLSGVKLSNVTFGDVWYCSGQSNMALSAQYTFSTERVRQLVEKDADKWRNQIRTLWYAGMNDAFFAKDNPTYVIPRQRGAASWKRLESNNIEAFSGTCLYFGLQLQLRLEQLGMEPVPIGLIHAAIGGTQIEEWMTNSTTRKCTATNIENKQRATPGTLFNGLVAPVVNTTIKGIVWYQGENNVYGYPGVVGGREGYSCMLVELIKLWRSLWSSQGREVPVFGVATLASGGSEGHGTHMAQFRLAQVGSQRVLDKVFVAHAYDLGDPWPSQACLKNGCCPPSNLNSTFVPAAKCLQFQEWMDDVDLDGNWTGHYAPIYMGAIHPRNKRRLGDRLAWGALSVAYNKGKFINPRIRACSFTANDKLALSFDTGDSDLLALSKEQRVVFSPGLQVCSGNVTACTCPYWDYNSTLKEWVCTYDGMKNKDVLERLRTTVGERPPANPYLKYWSAVQDFSMVDGMTVQLSGVQADVMAISFAWGDQPCCDWNRNISGGWVPCPPRNCGLFTANQALPPDPFFVVMDHTQNTCHELQ